MIGVPTERAENIFFDTESVYRNASFSESQIKKKHQAISFHQERIGMADNIIIVHKVDTNDNLADILTKSLSGCNRVQIRTRII